MTDKLLSIFSQKKLFLIVLLCLNAILHLPFLNYPPCSSHVWRQCNTLAVTRNFYEEEMNIFKPRVDRRLDGDGVTGMQFPSYEYAAALICKATGYHEWVIRLFSLFIFSLGLLFFYGCCRFLFQSDLAGALGAWCMCWCPELFYHGINALPDVFALTTMLAGWYYFLRWTANNRFSFLLASIALITLAGLTKMQFASVFAFAGTYLLVAYKRKDKSLTKISWIIAGMLLSSLLVLSWYFYANQLIEKSNLRDFGISISQPEDFASTINILIHNLVSNIPELLLNYATFLLLVLGLVFLIRSGIRQKQWLFPFLMWAILLSIYHVAEIHQMKQHNYYMIIYVPLLLIPAVYAGLMLYQNNKYRVVLLLLLLAQPVLATLRILPARWLNKDPGIPLEFADRNSRRILEEAIPGNPLCIVGPDRSGCIYLYFLHKKGFGFEASSELTEKMPDGTLRIENYIQRGARYLVTDNEELLHDSTLVSYFALVRQPVGRFSVITLKNKTQ